MNTPAGRAYSLVFDHLSRLLAASAVAKNAVPIGDLDIAAVHF